jgi:hypothetical protein
MRGRSASCIAEGILFERELPDDLQATIESLRPTRR